MQYIEQQATLIKSTLQTPIRQWRTDDYQRFIFYIVEDSIVNLKRKIEDVHVKVYWERNPQYSRGLHWYFISDDNLKKMGLHEHIESIYLHMELCAINIHFEPISGNDEPYVKELRSFARNLCPLPIIFDQNNYKEKIRYAESIMDRLESEFRM